MVAPLKERLRERLLARPSGCWEWQGYRDKDGYGQISSGRRNPKLLRVHRALWEIVFGSIPKGMCVCHSCDNPPCANPAHLFLGTDASNMADRDGKKRQAKGEAHGSAKLTVTQVEAIRIDPRSGPTIAAEHGIGRTLVSQIKRRLIWGDVP